MDSLETYRTKRNFRQTPEPSGKRGRAAKAEGGIFVIHKHDATRLHYDLRLEHNGVLWSWAVTRGPSLDPHEKRLAVHVEDHPLDYGSFEGNIPEGQYGTGSVIVWDEGRWMPEGDPAAGMKKGHIRFELLGHKLNGAWHLVRLRPRPGEKRDNWLLIKSDDVFARPGEDILEEKPHSMKSGRTSDEVAAGKKAARTPLKAEKKAEPARPAKAKKSATAMPDFFEPQLATLRSNPPTGEEWLHEVKFDGYRIQAHISSGKVALFTRKGLDWTGKFGKAIPETLAALDCEDAVIDGEVAVLSDKGVASFSALQAALSASKTERMLFYVFDLLHLDGEDLRGEPLVERKAELHELVGATEGESPVLYSEHFGAPGQAMLAHACKMGLEGVVSKRADAPYQSGRSLSWIKSKCTLRQEFVILGYVPSTAARRGLRSLLVGYHDKGKLHYGGRVGTGFSDMVTNDLKKRLDRITTKTPSIDGPEAKDRKVVWARPELVAEIEFRSWTSDGILRQASFQGLREDKPAKEVVAETGVLAKDEDASTKASAPRAAKSPRRKPGTMSVTLTSPDKLLWPEAKVSKEDLLAHYEKVWPRIEPFVVNRPLSLVRAPDGVDGQRFFQKHASKGMHEAIIRTPDPEDGEELLSIRDFDGLAALVQFGVVEVHVWGSMLDTIEKPDLIVFDLDPDEGLGVEDVRAATLDVKERLDALGLPNFVKTSGGKGFHVVVPLKPRADWDAVKTFSHDFARAMEQSAPDRYTSVLSKKAREGRIFVDYLRNGRGSTAVAPWSSRGKPTATVAVPVTFEMVKDGVGPADFTIGSKALEDVLKRPDPWADFFKAAKPLKL